MNEPTQAVSKTDLYPFQMKLLDDRLKQLDMIPTRGTQFSAGIDLRLMNCEGEPIQADDVFLLRPGHTRLVGTGVSVAIPFGMMGGLMPRSGMGHKLGLVLGNLIGVIDADYRGEVFASLWNRTETPIQLRGEERIAQLVVMPIVNQDPLIVSELPSTERGDGGFGHTGSK